MPVSIKSSLSLMNVRAASASATSPPPAKDDTFSALAIAADGWTLDATLLGSTAQGSYSGLNDFAAPGGKLVVTRKTPTPADPTATTDFDVPLTSVKRKPYPDGADRQETVSGSDIDTAFSLASFIYANETVSALFEAGFFTDDGAGGSSATNSGGTAEVTNNSLLDYPVPIMAWLTPPNQRIAASDWAPQLVVDHWYARNGRPVYAVVFTATDEHSNSVSATVTSLTDVAFSASGLSVGVMQPSWDLSTLTDGDVVTIDAAIYPWIGDVFTISTHGFGVTSPNIAPLEALCDAGGTYGTVHAYVDGVGGGTPQASTNEATAAANPFSTILAAATAAISVNNSTYGRNNTSGVIIHIPAGTDITALGGSLNGLAIGDLPLIIRGENRATSTFTTYSGIQRVQQGTQFENMVVKRPAGAGTAGVGLTGDGTLASVLTFIDCDFDLNGEGVYDAWFYKTGRSYFVNCGGDYCGQGSVFALDVQGTALAAGCTFVPLLSYNVIASKTDNYIGFADRLGDPQGMVCMNSIVSISSASAACLRIDEWLGPYGASITGMIMEKYGVDSPSPAISIVADGNLNAAENVIIRGSGIYGERSNLLYQDTGTEEIVKRGLFAFCIEQLHNSKSDYFGTSSGNRVGNWSFRHGVDCLNNFIDLGDSSGATTPRYDHWLGEALGDAKNEMPRGYVVTGDPAYADDQSGPSGAGGGDYEPGEASDIPAIPAGMAWSSVDLLGTTIPNDGSGVAGAVQRTG